jgi:hypothetical protein
LCDAKSHVPVGRRDNGGRGVVARHAPDVDRSEEKLTSWTGPDGQDVTPLVQLQPLACWRAACSISAHVSQRDGDGDGHDSGGDAGDHRPGQAPAPIELVETSNGYVTAGAVLIPVGLVMAAGMWALVFTCGENSGCALANLITWPILGAGAVFTGIGLLAYGAARSQTEIRINRPGESKRATPRLAGLGLSPTRSGAALGAAFSF